MPSFPTAALLLAGWIAPTLWAASISDVFVQPSVRQKKVTLEIEVQGATAGTAKVTAEMINPKTGASEKTLSGSIALKGGASEIAFVDLPWADPRLWDLGKPELYTCKLTIDGVGSYEQGFGFREIWIQGRDFWMNGSIVRFRPINVGWGGGHSAVGTAKLIDERIGWNFNLFENWPGNGDAATDPKWAEGNVGMAKLCDERGVGMTAVPPFIKTDTDTPEGYRQRCVKMLKTVRNHPSILMWGGSGNAFQNGRDQDPRLFGTSGWIFDLETEARFNKGIAINAQLKAYDPTRPTFSHAGGYVGDVYTTNNYFCMTPLQEREEWLSAWAKTGTMPLFSVEFGNPLFTTFLRGRTEYGHALETEPLVTEWAAAYFGKAAYADEKPEYRKTIAARHQQGMKYRNWRDGGHDPALLNHPGLVAVTDLFNRNTWRSWRTYGISGGMIPWEDNNNHGERMKEPNRPTVAYVGGPAETFTEKSHAFAPGQKVAKSAVLINDRRTELPYSVSWQISVGGGDKAKPITGTKSGKLKAGEIAFVPIAFTVPAKVEGDGRGAIALTASIGDDQHQDRFPIQVVAAPTALKLNVTVVDPLGETSAMLKALGLNATPFDPAKPPAATSVVVIGRKLLSNRGTIPFDVEAFVSGGGRLLICGQDRQWLRSLGLRTAQHLPRRAFAVDAKHPILDGLGDDHLADWAGTSTIEPERSDFQGLEPWWAPLYGWHWGNRGSVASAAIEKPHRGSWRPVLECEFDLAYSPLMELDYGAGRVTLCTLDLEDNVAKDAAARRLAAQVLSHVAKAPLAKKAPIAGYLGDDAGAKLLDDLGVRYVKAAAPAGGLLILGTGGDEAAATAHAAAGGTVVVLPAKQGQLGAQIAAKADFFGSLIAPAWAQTAGLSASDLRWRSSASADLLTGGDGIELGADGLLGRKVTGKGAIVWCQVDPRALPADTKTYFRYTRWRMTRALCQVLADGGATFAQDQRQLQLIQKPDHVWYLAGTWEAQFTLPLPEKHPRQGQGDPGITAKAAALVLPDAPAEGWEKVILPNYQEGLGPNWKGKDGEAVWRYVVDVPEHLAGRDLIFSFGRIDETESGFFNGEAIGTSSDWLSWRRHNVPGKLVKAGRNVLALRTWDAQIHGGVCGEPALFWLATRPTSPVKLYHDDFRALEKIDDFGNADDPYRYFRW